MSSQSVQPLRIQKNNSGALPSKTNGAPNRPLTELSPMAVRRNSPSFPGSPGKAKIFKGDSSPFNSSPQNVNTASSPRLFWQGRDPASPARENQSPYEDHSPMPAKRSSIENLKKASRVKNSSIFAREQNNNYDPSKPNILDRPLATGRPLSMQVQGNAFGGQGMQGLRKENEREDTATILLDETQPMNAFLPLSSIGPLSPSKSNASPTKSSLSKRTGANARHMGFDPDTGIWSDEDDLEKKLPEGKGLHRRGKSVTFDQAPPQVNEYEMTTPDPSSVASGSREGSYESMEDDDEASFERGSSMDREDSFDASLEDTHKTPVVMPEDWRFMSPENANTELAQHEEDVFEDDYGSPAPNAQPGAQEYRPHQTSVNSVDSNGQPRPLPPLPSTMQSTTANAEMRDSFSGTMERISNAQRSLPSPPQASSISKSDIRRMSGGSFSLEDRLRIMALQEQGESRAEAERQRQRRMRRGCSKDPSPSREPKECDQLLEEQEKGSGSPGPAIADYEDDAPHVSRESILRRLRSQQDLNADEAQDESSNGTSHMSSLTFDPDVPIPSLEDPTQVFVHPPYHKEVVIKEEEVDDDELYSIPDMYNQSQSGSDAEDDTTSQYSQASFPAHVDSQAEEGQETPRAQSPVREPKKNSMTLERISLPDFTDFGEESSFDLGLDSYMTPPTEQKASEKQHNNFDLGYDSYVTPPMEQKASEKPLPQMPIEYSLPDLQALRDSIQRPFTPEEQLQPPRFSMPEQYDEDEPGTPDSVIRHPLVDKPVFEIAEPEATAKVPGLNLNTRPSTTPANAQSMAATKQHVSRQVSERPPIPERHHQRPSFSQAELQQLEDRTTPSTENTLQEKTAKSEPKKRVSSLVQLEIPRDQSDDGLGFGLEKEFDRVVEAQKVAFELSLQRLYYPFNGRFPSSEYPDTKDSRNENPFVNAPILPKPRGARALPGDLPARGHIYPTDGSVFANRSPWRQRGYLMRQNTKVVVASERISEDEPQSTAATSNNLPDASEAHHGGVQVSPRKISQPTWTAEPWNGKLRRKSIRVGGESGTVKRKPVEGPAPPLPGQSSNVQDGLGALIEDELAEEEAEDLEDGAERGRLFVKVVGVKDLDLPLPKHERTSFALTLDNGLHCVTTAWLDLARSAPIGQEFELVVLNDLEFQLTLQMKLEEPRSERPQSPTKSATSPTKKSGTFGRFFGSPKKKREAAEQLRAQQEIASRPITPPSAYEMVQGLVAKDGSFARAYVALSEHEKQTYGRPYSVDVACFNEWAMEEVNVGSSRSKKSVTQLQRRPPYPIGKLELQLLYIPKPKGAKDEDMPKSMNGAVRELRDAEARMKQEMKEFEGHLSQQGGDCPYWRRRFFKLVGTKLTAYHEATLQPRATINLAKASKIIDDKSALMQKETSTKGGGRRKSAFADDEEGYMFVEEGFRIRFANGEVIDFYADSAGRKDEWMAVLTQIVGKGPIGPGAAIKPWAETVLKREKSVIARENKMKAPGTSPVKARTDTFRHDHMALRNGPAMQATGHSAVRPKSAQESIPSPTRAAPRPQAHARTESYQPQSGSRSQAGSPVKSKVTKEERHRKTKSMQWS